MQTDENTTNFIPAVELLSPKTNVDIYFLFYKNELLVKSKDNSAVIPTFIDLENLELISIQYFGSINGLNCFCGQLDKDTIIPSSMYFSKLKALTHKLSEDMFWISGRAIQIVNFYTAHKYCGICGSLTHNLEGERAMKCPKCNFVNYPRISPAIIVAVIKENKLLLAHNNGFPKDLYSVVAGFVEAGETLEDCVIREVSEETGINVKNIKYFGNQPWPFPNSLMIGFTAEYESGEINVDGKEIDSANFYTSRDMPLTPDSISIAKKLIDWFTKNY
ncbi:NAD(+) diphosphatase [Clostridium sp.]|uniref:NAD(+) diphosphatase n=1 Tax=Clostridium sp. TaxID=1506 RepID=UPI001A40D01A|nr:NAD(+) diphosphatase [Clostridium sp.]MBK5241886.1 NAD(+) diphosphatase [Clostridium sp.]